ncbi:MAG: hypothetical protein IJV31_02535 [Clostridia bacterium]|nr:hypothetical protein [Clostridia bacterium]
MNMTYFIAIIAVLFIGIIIAYVILNKKMQKTEYAQIKKLQQGTKAEKMSSEILLQKLYLLYSKTPFFKGYILKLRRRIEIINVDDEYTTRKEAAKILNRALIVLFLLFALTTLMAHRSPLLMSILFLFELFIFNSYIDDLTNKLDDKLLEEQVQFFSEIRHAYHEFNMVEEAIYQVSLDDEKVISKQGEKIYEILISDDPETELEKYYDVAPNSYLKEFAGISYLTKEFGDRKENGTSLYLKNINNITQEMQLEILKRDKLKHVFQSLTVISIVPVLLLEPLKNWAVGNFSFTESFYKGKAGMIVQLLIVVLTLISYLLTRKLKDSGSTYIDTRNTQNPWQERVYKKTKKIVDLFIPKPGTAEDRKLKDLLKDSASKLKMNHLYVNKLCLAILTGIVSILLIFLLHHIAVQYVYEEPTSDYDLIGGLSEKEKAKADEVTKIHNVFLDMFKGKPNVTQQMVENAMAQSQYYIEAEPEEITKQAKKVMDKLKIVNNESLQWYDLLIDFLFAYIAYQAPTWLLYLQKIMRQLEMENEVMQFQTIILMLMKLERINVEMILEWLERYANIFKEPISKCVNNYEAGGWEALEELKNTVSFEQFIRIVESLQAAVEKIPIRDAFDELDADRDYYQEKRKEANDRLISRKGMMGKAVGFAPLVVIFVGYLIVPLVFIGMTAMGSSFSSLS